MVLRALAKDDKQRFPHIQDFVQALEQAASNKLSAAISRTPEKSLQPPQQPHTIAPTVILEGKVQIPLHTVTAPVDPPAMTTANKSGAEPSNRRPAPFLERLLGGRKKRHPAANDRKIVMQLQKQLKSWDASQQCEYDKQGRVTILDLSELGLREIPSEVWKFSALQVLHLRKNKVNVLPLEVGNLSALKWLNLSFNELVMLPPEIGKLTHLQTLHLIGSHLSTLPSEIGELTSLDTLDLRDNQFSVFPPEIGKLTALRHLFLGGNQLTTVPTRIGDFTALLMLGLEGNQLTVLPSEVGKLTGLLELNLERNQLTMLPPRSRKAHRSTKAFSEWQSVEFVAL